MGMMRLIEKGDIGFNDSISDHVDGILQECNQTSMLKLWGGDERISKVTVY